MAQAEKLDLGEEKPAPSSSKKLIFIVIGTILVTVIAIFATLYFLGVFPPKHDKARTHGKASGHEATSEQEHAAETKPVTYEALTPAFVVNFKGNPEIRVVQIEMTLASTDPAILDALKKNSPMLRNNVLMLISAQDPMTFKTAEGKEALRTKIKEEIKKIVITQTDKKEGVDEIYFTGFVMQ